MTMSIIFTFKTHQQNYSYCLPSLAPGRPKGSPHIISPVAIQVLPFHQLDSEFYDSSLLPNFPQSCPCSKTLLDPHLLTVLPPSHLTRPQKAWPSAIPQTMLNISPVSLVEASVRDIPSLQIYCQDGVEDAALGVFAAEEECPTLTLFVSLA